MALSLQPQVMKFLYANLDKENVNKFLKENDVSKVIELMNEFKIPIIYQQIFNVAISGNQLALDIIVRLNKKYVQSIKSNIYDVQFSMVYEQRSSYNQETKITFSNGKEYLFFPENGHMMAYNRLPDFLVNGIHTSRVESLDEPVINVSIKIDGQSRIIYFIRDDTNWALTYHSRTGPLLFAIANDKITVARRELVSIATIYSGDITKDVILSGKFHQLEAVAVYDVLHLILTQVPLPERAIFVCENLLPDENLMRPLHDKIMRTSALERTSSALAFFEVIIDGKRVRPLPSELNTVQTILSPRGRSNWSLREVIQLSNKNVVSVDGKRLDIHPLVTTAISHLFPEKTEFPDHPIEGVVVWWNGFSLKIKDPKYMDKYEKNE